MRTFIFTPPQLLPAEFGPDAALAWTEGDPRDAELADATMSAWERLVHAHRSVCVAGDALARARCGFVESAEALAEASIELRYLAHILGEVEYSDEIAADTLREALARILRVPPPERLRTTHERLCVREHVYRLAREEALEASVSYREAWRRLAVEARRFRSRRNALRQAARHLVRLARAA